MEIRSERLRRDVPFRCCRRFLRQGSAGGRFPGHGARHADGSILIIALGVLTLLSILGVAFASLMRLEKRATENYIDGKRMDMLLDSALDRTIADLQGAKNFRSFTYYQDTPWLNILGAGRAGRKAERDLAHGRADIEDPRVGTWELFSQREGHRGTYKTKVIDCAAQINLNGKQDTLARMLDNLGQVIESSERLRRDGKRIRNPFYTEPNGGGNRVRGEDVIRFRRLLPGGRFTSKSQLKYIIGPENYQIVKDFLTCYSYEDPYTYKATDGLDLVPEIRGQGLSGSGGLGSGGASAIQQAPAYGTPRLDAEPRHPININTAPEEVLISCLMGLAGRRIFPYAKLGVAGGSVVPIDQNAQILGERVIGNEEYGDVTPRGVFVYSPPLEYDQAKRITDRIIAERKIRPFMAWRTNDPNRSLGFEDFVDLRLDESFFPNSANAIIVDPEQPQNRQIQSQIMNSGGATPIGRLWQKGHAVGAERQLRRQKGLASHQRFAFYYDLVKGVLKANANPNSRINRYNPNEAAYVPVDKSDLVRIERDRATLTKGHTTEFCFDTMGFYEITTMGSIEELKGLARRKGLTVEARGAAPDPLARPFQRKTRTVVQVFDVLRHTSQLHFEKTYQALGRSSKQDRRYVVTWPEPVNALTELYSRGTVRDGRIELAGLLDGERLQAAIQTRPQLYKKNPSVIMAHGFQDRDSTSIRRLQRALRGAGRNLFSDEMTDALREVCNANYSRGGSDLHRRIVSRREVINLGGGFDQDAIHRDPLVNKEILGTDILPDGFYTGLSRMSHLQSRVVLIPARQRIGVASSFGGSNTTVGESGVGSKGKNIEGNVPYYRGGLAFWVKFEFDGDDPVFSGLIGCTQVITAVVPAKGDYKGSEGTQFFIFRNSEGYLRVVRMYYHQAFYLSGGADGGGGGGGGGGEGGLNVNLFPDVEDTEGSERNPIKEHIDQQKIISRVDKIIDTRHFKAHEWHHIALDWDDQNPSSSIRVYLDFQESREGGAPRRAQAEVSGEANSWVRLNERQPRDGLMIGGIIRNQGVDDAGVFKWWTNSSSAGGAGSTVRTFRPSIKRILANATIDEVITYEGQFASAKQYYASSGSPGYFTNQTGEYSNLFEIPVPPDVDSVVLRSFDWTSYYPVGYADSQPNSPYLAVRVEPITAQVFYRSATSPPSAFQEPWRQPSVPNRVAGRRASRDQTGGILGKNIEFVYKFTMRGGQSQRGNTIGGFVHTPVIDDVTLTYFLPTPRILIQEEAD